MMITISLNEIATLLAIIFGLTGLILGILNYLRDSVRLKVDLRWDVVIHNDPKYDEKSLWGIISITNVGKRSTYISHASLKLPKGFEYNYHLVYEAIRGEKLEEGYPPKIYVINQNQLEPYSKKWKKIRAVVFDSTGKSWYSKKPKKSPIPSWANKKIQK